MPWYIFPASLGGCLSLGKHFQLEAAWRTVERKIAHTRPYIRVTNCEYKYKLLCRKVSANCFGILSAVTVVIDICKHKHTLSEGGTDYTLFFVAYMSKWLKNTSYLTRSSIFATPDVELILTRMRWFIRTLWISSDNSPRSANSCSFCRYTHTKYGIMSYVEIRFTNPIIKSREICVKLFEFVDQVINCLHIDTIELVVFDQWFKATIIVCICTSIMRERE